MEHQDKGFFTRHSLKPNKQSPESEQYTGLSQEGEALARERAKNELTQFIETAEPKSVTFLGGASEAPRTKSTVEVYADQLKQEFRTREDVIVFSKDDIDTLLRERAGEKISAHIAQLLEEHSEQKVVVSYPLFLKQFKMGEGRWTEQGDYSSYLKALLSATGKNEQKAFELWIQNQGKMEHEGQALEGPHPQDVAEEHLEGLKRLQRFAKKFLRGRTLNIGFVGHSFNLDALAIYLANDGHVDAQGLERVKEQIQETEMGSITFDGEDVTFDYRGNRYDLRLDER